MYTERSELTVSGFGEQLPTTESLGLSIKAHTV